MNKAGVGNHKILIKHLFSPFYHVWLKIVEKTKRN